jgi:hypothetical protein
MTTQDRNKASAAIFTAAADGKECEWDSHDKGWVKCDPFAKGEYGNVINYPKLYRIKPKPVTRPWSKPEDVPLNCWVRSTRGSGDDYGLRSNDPDSMHAMLVTVSINGISYISKTIQYVAWGSELLGRLEYSFDRKTWQPCVVTEAQP